MDRLMSKRRHTGAAPAALLAFVMALLLLAPALAAETIDSASSTDAAPADDFSNLIENYQKQIQAKKDAAAQLKQQIDAYQKQIVAKHQEAATVASQLAITDNKIAQTRLDIQSNQLEIDATNLEIKDLDTQIQDKTLKIMRQREMIGEFLRTIKKNDAKTSLDLLLTENTISDFFNDVQFLHESQRDLKDALDVAKTLQADLQARAVATNSKRQHLQEIVANLAKDNDALAEDKAAKVALADQAQADATRFQYQTAQLKKAIEDENNDVNQIERKLRKTLDAQRLQVLSGNPDDWGWPVDPGRGITAYFHDQDYPFRYLFEHPAIDIRVAQGTPVHAAKGGYVARAKNGGMGYSYIMIVHDDGMSTVYGHVSRIMVKEDTYVEKGDVIALSGAMPGTPGAGPYTTGPHMHFEIRLNGIPVDPLQYMKL